MAKYGDTRFAASVAKKFDWEIKPKLMDLAIDDPRIDLAFSAQRELDDELASQMAEHFMPAAAAGITVAELPDGSLVFVDGQHRWKAAIDAGQSTVVALMFKMSHEQAAALFRLKNGSGIRLVRHIESTNAAIESTAERWVDMQHILQKHECVLNRERSRKEGGIGASKIVEKIYNVDDGELLDVTLEVITDAWGHDSEVLVAPVLVGVALFLAHNRKQLHVAELRDLKDKLHTLGVNRAIGNAKTAWRGVRGANLYAYMEQEITSTYNAHRTSKRLPDFTPRQLGQMPDLVRLAIESKPLQLPLAPDPAPKAEKSSSSKVM